VLGSVGASRNAPPPPDHPQQRQPAFPRLRSQSFSLLALTPISAQLRSLATALGTESLHPPTQHAAVIRRRD